MDIVEIAQIAPLFAATCNIDGEPHFLARDDQTGYPYWTSMFSSAYKTAHLSNIQGDVADIVEKRVSGKVTAVRVVTVHTHLVEHSRVGPSISQLETALEGVEVNLRKTADRLAQATGQKDWLKVVEYSKEIAQLVEQRDELTRKIENF
jgi:hypothetical protein